MSPLELLLGALHANPDDDTARLALADSLEEQGLPDRAELTRLHASLRREPDERPRRDWERRVQELLRAGVVPCVPEVVNSIGMRFALIPAGVFVMGAPETEPESQTDEYPRHRVEITCPFYLGVFPVTHEQYQAVMGRNPSRFAVSTGTDLVGDADPSSFPVDGPSWESAVEFCVRLGKLSGEREAARKYRLPTEAEWEYACRGGASATTATYVGRGLPSTLANYDGNFPYQAPEGPYLNRPSAVGSYPSNAFGLHDMLGNVWEWCADYYSATWYRDSPLRDPQGPAAGPGRVLRGGCWFFGGPCCRSAHREWADQEEGSYFRGFRVAADWPAAPR
jgi:uncharacterized protein (TIGR02996 family)